MIKLQQVGNRELDLSVSGLWYDLWLAQLPDDAVIVDIGSNVGLSTITHVKGRLNWAWVKI